MKDCSFWREHYTSLTDFEILHEFVMKNMAGIKFAEVVPHRCSSKQQFCKYAADLQ